MVQHMHLLCHMLRVVARDKLQVSYTVYSPRLGQVGTVPTRRFASDRTEQGGNVEGMQPTPVHPRVSNVIIFNDTIMPSGWGIQGSLQVAAGTVPMIVPDIHSMRPRQDFVDEFKFKIMLRL